MRTLPAGLTTLLDEPVIALCRLVQMTRKDGVVVRFAESQQTITFSGTVYPPAKGVRMSSVPFVLNNLRSSVDFEVATVNGGSIDPDDVRNGRYDNADVVISACENVATTSNGISLFLGRVGEVEITDRGLAKIEVLGLLSKAREIPIEHYVPTCPKFFGDERCQYPIGPLTITRTISSISGFSITLNASVDSFYRLGTIRKDGVNEAYEIRQVTGATLLSYLPLTGKLTAGDTVILTPGCDFTYDGAQGCVFWNNEVNFGGFVDIPGADVMDINFTDWGA